MKSNPAADELRNLKQLVEDYQAGRLSPEDKREFENWLIVNPMLAAEEEAQRRQRQDWAK